MLMQSTLEVEAAHYAEFETLMKELVALQGKAGWTLLTAFTQITGQLYTYVDVWEMEDAGTYQRGLTALRGHPDSPRIRATLAKCIKRETVVLGAKASYA